jgi:hypothetical protein
MRQISFVTVLLALSALHCSSSKSNNPPYPDATSFCAGLAQAECNNSVLTACFATTTSDKRTACLSDRERVCNDDIVTPAQLLGLTYDSGQAEACVGVASRAYSDAKLTSTEVAEVEAACGSVFSRMGARNAVCTSDADCNRSAGLRCVSHPTQPDAGAPEGSCQSPSTPVPGGNSCAAPDAVCVTGYHCDASYHCIQDVAPPGKCNSVDICASTATCSPDGMCVSKLASGATCTSNEECLSGICLEGASLCADSQAISATDPFCTAMRE